MTIRPLVSILTLSLLTLTTPACNLANKYCIGDCLSDPGGIPDATTGDLGVSETGLPDPTTGEPGAALDPAPTCDLVDTIVGSTSCFDKIVQPGELCFVIGGGSFMAPLGVDLVSMIAVPLEGVGFDLLVSREDHSVYAELFAQGEGLAQSTKKWPVPILGGGLIFTAVGYFNEDGFADVAARMDGPAEDTIIVLLLDGTGGLLAQQNVMQGVDLAGPDLYDGDEDGHLDLLVTLPTGVEPENAIVLHGDGDGAFVKESAFGASKLENIRVTGALDIDGVHNDLVVAGDDGLNVLNTHPGGDTLLSLPLGQGTKVQDLGLADLNGDGLGDIVALVEDLALGTSEVVVFTRGPDLAEDAPEFASVHYTVHCGATNLVIADIDADGAPDLATAGAGAGSPSPLTIRRNDGAGGFADVLTVGVEGPVSDLFVVDLNGDGAADIANSARSINTIGFIPAAP